MKPKAHRLRVGLFAVGLAAYWPQFGGLKPRLQGFKHIIKARLSEYAEPVDAGLIDSAPDAAAAGDLFAREGVELIVCYVATYATSGQVLPAAQKARVPVLILNLQPVSALDYAKADTGEWLANCGVCRVPEIACGFGVSVEARVKLGPVTLFALTQTADGQLKGLAAEGESITGPTLQIGNTNSRIKFAGGMTNFVNRWCAEGPTHHCALGVGHEMPVLRNIAALLKRPFVEIV
jgi:L-arabinose isomerase